MPRVSVICTVKNGADFIGQTINSVIEQSFKDWEMILVDDGSSDNTVNIIEELIETDKRIKLITTSGIGRGNALNLAIDSSNGKYIANIDADDPSHPNRLEIQVNVLDNHKDYGVIATDVVTISGEGVPEWNEDYQRNNIPIEDVTDLFLVRNPISHSSVIMRKSDLIELGKYDLSRNSQYDYELWVRYITNSFLIGKIPLELSSKRIHKSQSFENKKRIKYIIGSCKIQYKAIKNQRKNSFYYILPIFNFFYGLLPQQFRVKVNKITKHIRSI